MTTVSASHQAEIDDGFVVPYEGNRFCGPYVLAHIIQSTPDEAAAHLRRIGGKRSIMGVSNQLLLRALSELGYSAQEEMPSFGWRRHPLKVKEWLSHRSNPDALYIVNVTRHYIIVQGDRYFDNQCHYGRDVSRVFRRAVRNAWLIKREAVN